MCLRPTELNDEYMLNKFKCVNMCIYVDHIVSTSMCSMGSLILLLISYLIALCSVCPTPIRTSHVPSRNNGVLYCILDFWESCL
jgi:hypothetical protein